ncbi:tetratricopeptide repeat protein [Nitratifractor sp.]
MQTNGSKLFPHALWSLIALGALALAEPSVYGGGYGGSSAQAAKNKTMIYALRQKVARMQEEIEGMRSIINSLSQQVNQLSRQSRAPKSSSQSDERIRALDARIAALEKASGRSGARVRTPAKSSASNQSSGRKPTPKTESKVATKGERGSLEKAASDKLFSRGVRLVKQKKYSEAKRRFTILSSRNYKPASTNFYLGEIAYRTGHYDDAIKYYQKSAELNENAAYMDRLLLHTAIALEKSGDREQARNFFQAIVDGYPGTSSAREAKKHLK